MRSFSYLHYHKLALITPPPPSNGPINLYTKNTSDYDHEPSFPPDINPLHRYWNESDLLWRFEAWLKTGKCKRYFDHDCYDCYSCFELSAFSILIIIPLGDKPLRLPALLKHAKSPYILQRSISDSLHIQASDHMSSLSIKEESLGQTSKKASKNSKGKNTSTKVFSEWRDYFNHSSHLPFFWIKACARNSSCHFRYPQQ